MLRIYSSILLLSLCATGTATAQDDPGENRHPCAVIPVYHCAEHLDNGITLGHFGYDMQCPPELEAIQELYVPIGDDNFFSSDPKDRGQPTFFQAGFTIGSLSSK